jgi:beta-lactam-binding protein with PASTA domain
MRSCPRCGRDYPDDVHFCSCGAFLDWDPPAEPDVTAGPASSGAGPATAIIASPPVVGTVEHVSLQLFPPDQPIDGLAVELSVPAGGRTTVIARVRNQSGIVDSYQLGVEGLPDEWWTIDPPTAYLLPSGSREGYEEDVVIAVHPPRTPDAEARRWPFTVTVVSQSHPTRLAHASASVDVEPFWQIAAVARPTVVMGRRRATLSGAVTNDGNASIFATLAAADAEDRCTFEPPAAPFQIPPGEVAAAPIVVRPKRPLAIGRPLDHRLELVAQTTGAEALAAAFPAVYRQRPWIRLWVPIVLLLLVLIAVLAYLLWPDRVDVPDLRKAPSAFAAQKRLEKVGLRLDPKVRRVTRKGAPAGSVVGQAPAPGTAVDDGDSVAVVVAAGRGRVTVPSLEGKRVAAADEKLQKAGLTLGAVEPKLDPKGKVGSQLPRAGVKRRRGTPVSVVLAKPAKGKDGKKAGQGGAKGGAAAAAAPVPAVAGGDMEAAKAELKKAGIEPVLRWQIDAAERGTVLRTVPPVGMPPPATRKIELFVSAGFPQLAYDTMDSAFVVDGLRGGPVAAVVDATSLTTGGSWAPDGQRLAYVSGESLFVGVPGSASPHRRVRERRPVTYAAFAPSKERRVLAYAARRRDGHDDVCWLDLAKGFDHGSCRHPRNVEVTGFSWSRNGAELLASVVKGGDLGLLRFVTDRPFSARRDEWEPSDGLVMRGVRAAAFSPDGGSLAVVSNLHHAYYRVALMAPGDFELEKPDYLPVQGCDIAWRPDGAELAVVQAGSDCSAPMGPIVRVRPNDRTLEIVALNGRHPAWQPLGVNLEPGR